MQWMVIKFGFKTKLDLSLQIPNYECMYVCMVLEHQTLEQRCGWQALGHVMFISRPLIGNFTPGDKISFEGEPAIIHVLQDTGLSNDFFRVP